MNWTRLIARNINLIKWLYPSCIWNLPNNQKKVYLTFDDGPTPKITQWVLSELLEHGAKATFFLIGEKIEKHSEIVKQILNEGHSVGNHTYNHLNGWKTKNTSYIQNTEQCHIQLQDQIQPQFQTSNFKLQTSKLFRPPYGKIKRAQIKELKSLGYKIMMWNIISEDYSSSISPEKCLKNVLENVQSGSIIVFHDSEKSFKNLKFVLPKTLDFLKENNYTCEAL
jgi:peptidoglycan-N-acetylglucosamine deacetylase